MRILFQGAGAIGLAGAALFGDRHEVAVVTRTPMPRPRAAYPRRVGWFGSGAASAGSRRIRAKGEDAAVAGAREAGDVVPATRRVTVTDWAGIEAAGGFRLSPEDSADAESGGGADAGSGGGADAGSGGGADAGSGDGVDAESAPAAGVTIAQARRHAQRGGRRNPRDRRVQDSWELVVVTTRPGDLDEAVASAIRAVAPRWVAITSQVDGDLEVARSLFPGAEVVLFGPAIISERVEDSEPGRDVRYWSPAGAPVFLVAGRTGTVRRLCRELGSLVLPVPLDALIVPPALFIPFVAELSVLGGEWGELLVHLRQPSRAAAEAIRGLTGVPVPVVPLAARAVLELAERLSPIPMRKYAGRHFARHEGQTMDMLDGWIARAESRGVGHEALTRLGEAMRNRTRTVPGGN